MLERGGGGDVADHRAVEAGDGPERLERVVVATVAVAPDERVGQPQQRRRRRRARPASRASASSGQAGRPWYSSWRTPASKRVWFRRRPSGSSAASGRSSGPGAQRVVGRGGLTVVVERASRVARAVGEEVVDRALEATRLAERHLRGAEGRVDRAVEHERPHVVGVRLGVARAEDVP